jgi:hypothetical protein
MKLRWWKTREEIEFELTNKILANMKAEQEREFARLAEETRLQAELEAKAKEEAEARFKAEEDARLKAEEELKAQQEPWVDIKGWVESPEHGLKIELDYNAAFVTYLRDAGIKGIDDDQIVQKWLAMVSQDVSNNILEQEINNSITGSELE